MSATVQLPTRPPRQFLPESLTITTWDQLKPYFDDLLFRPLHTQADLRRWFEDRSEIEAVLSEDLGWRYVRMTCYTENAEYGKAYQDFVQNIQPELSPVADQLNRRAVEHPLIGELSNEAGFDIMIRNMRKDMEIFREANIPLFTEINTETQQYAQISGAMTITREGQELTLQQAGVLLMSPDRNLRESVYRQTAERRLADKDKLDQLFSKLIQLRHQVAVNAGFSNFRDYQFRAYGRFDYTPDDCRRFHESIEAEVVPILNQLAAERAKKLQLSKLRPWDKAVDADGLPALKAFDGGRDLTEKAITTFHQLDPWLGECLTIMREMGHLDLESRKGKAPGGYNYPLPEIGVPFIFMNATSTLRDMTTIMHEGGHAVHNFLTMNLPLADFKNPPMEVAELASMSMELLSMDHWGNFFPQENDLRRARREQLEDILETLPWVATIDQFQHWIYENPTHDSSARKAAWNEVFNRFADSHTDWSGLEMSRDYLWQKQLHLYEVPFYYIEYGMAQLGAIAVWRNFKNDRRKGLDGYMRALKLGNMKSIPETYAAAGIRFDFSRSYIHELMGFVKDELSKS